MGGGGGAYLNQQFRRWTQFSIKDKNAKWKSSSTRSWRLCSRGKKTNPNFRHMNKPSWINPDEVLQPRLINTVNTVRQKNKGDGRGAEKREGLINFLTLKREGLLEKGGFNREFRVNVRVLEEPPHLCIQITN